jgi:hypothetical protein
MLDSIISLRLEYFLSVVNRYSVRGELSETVHTLSNPQLREVRDDADNHTRNSESLPRSRLQKPQGTRSRPASPRLPSRKKDLSNHRQTLQIFGTDFLCGCTGKDSDGWASTSSFEEGIEMRMAHPFTRRIHTIQTQAIGLSVKLKRVVTIADRGR